MKRGWKIAALALGAALFCWVLGQADLGAVWQALRKLGGWAPVLLLPYFVVYLVDCWAWALTMPKGHGVLFWTLLRIRWAGESVNSIFPSAYVGGEAVKVWLLKEKGITPGAGAVSAVVSKTAQTAAQLLFVIAAALALWNLAGDQRGLRAGLLLVVAGGTAGVVGLFWLQSHGLFGLLLNWAGRLRFKPKIIEQRKARLLEVDGAIQGFYRSQPSRFYGATVLYLAGWMLDTVEIYLFAWLTGMPISWLQALAVEAFAGVAKVLGIWVPGSLGVQEAGIVMIGRLSGLPDPLAAGYALARRGRELIFAAAGLMLFYAASAGPNAGKSGPAEAVRQ